MCPPLLVGSKRNITERQALAFTGCLIAVRHIMPVSRPSSTSKREADAEILMISMSFPD